MKIQNSEIEEFATFILSLKLRGTENRMRNRLIKKLQNHLKLIQEEHKELLDEYCKKDEKDNFRTISKDGKTFYDIDDVKGFQIEFDLLMKEDLVIPNDQANQQMLVTVKDIILNCDKEFSGNEALKYENYCEMFEEINEVTII
jgi:hypothetical protein